MNPTGQTTVLAAYLERFQPPFDTHALEPLYVLGHRVGWVRPVLAMALAQAGLKHSHIGWQLDSPASTVDQSVATLALRLREQGFVPGWRSEYCTAYTDQGEPLFQAERALFRTLGMTSHAVHVHATTKTGQIWVAQRSIHKATDPGRLDNLAAGGVSAGETPHTTVLRELWEEAGVNAALCTGLRWVGAPFLSQRVESEAVHSEYLHIAHLVLPEPFEPTSMDGEVQRFFKVSDTEMADRLMAGEFTVDAGIAALLAHPQE